MSEFAKDPLLMNRADGVHYWDVNYQLSVISNHERKEPAIAPMRPTEDDWRRDGRRAAVRSAGACEGRRSRQENEHPAAVEDRPGQAVARTS